jgi:hypothetical protein
MRILQMEIQNYRKEGPLRLKKNNGYGASDISDGFLIPHANANSYSILDGCPTSTLSR